MNASPPQPLSQPLRGSETILVVEDEANILNLVVIALRRQGYEVLAATAPATALDLAARHAGKIDLLITDVVMPEMNGKELKEKLAHRQGYLKCLFMSGYTAEIIAQQGDLEPDVNFLQKPFTIQNLLEKVRQVLRPADGLSQTPPGKA